MPNPAETPLEIQRRPRGASRWHAWRPVLTVVRGGPAEALRQVGGLELRADPDGGLGPWEWRVVPAGPLPLPPRR